MAAYFRLIPAKSLPRLLATLLDGDVLKDVLRGLHAAYLPYASISHLS